MKQDLFKDTSLYLSQSYQDAWADYQRSLRNPAFPVWDYVILTASNAHQAEMFTAQIEARRPYLPARTTFAVIPDEGGVRVGSGGATLSVLKYLRAREPGFEGLRILVIHSGGDSKRIPQYSAVGKLFSPVPHQLPDGRASTLFDEFIIATTAVAGRVRSGMLLLSGDVLLLFNPLLVDDCGHGAACISFKEDAQIGQNHGVFLRGANGNVQAFLHKQSVETLTAAGAVNAAGKVDIDTGAVLFSPDLLQALYSLISTEDQLDPVKYAQMVNSRVRLSLYGDFQYPLAEASTLEQFYREQPEGEFCPELTAAREAVWQALRPFRMKLLRLAPAKFIHFGTTRETMRLMQEELPRYAALGWERRVSCAMDRSAGYISALSPRAEIGDDCYLELSVVHGGAKIGSGAILSYIDVPGGVAVPAHTVLHGLKQTDGNFVCRIYGVEDNPKADCLFGRPLTAAVAALGLDPALLWAPGEPHVLWTAQLYPVCGTVRAAVEQALLVYRMITQTDRAAAAQWQHMVRKSLCAGFNDADPQAILAWEARMRALVQMHRIADQAANGRPAVELAGTLQSPLTADQQQWLTDRLAHADAAERTRLHYYLGIAMGGADGEREIAAAFDEIRNTIVDASLSGLHENTAAHIAVPQHTVELPLRVNWGGGWSDTPPYCNENGGTVLNAAILLNGARPVKVSLTRLEEHKIVFESQDMGVHGEFTELAALQSVGDPFDPFVLQKAALLACGVLPAQGGSLEAVFDRLGGGFLMDTEVTGVPKGSGLGTSSILAAACVKALFEFLAIPYAEEDLYGYVLCMEQIMSTGGGWQDQVGGVTNGIKYITSKPGAKQTLQVTHVTLDPATAAELNDRFVLIYTGQRRLARNLLRDVVGSYVGNVPQVLAALDRIQRLAVLMRFELERGNVDAFAALLNEHWTQSRIIDAGSSNTLIDQIFDAIDDLIDGRMVCGAGGGGFLQAVLKKGASVAQLRQRLESVFQDTDINVWDCTLV